MDTAVPFKFAMGDQVKDRLSGFSGTVYARIEWYNGCLRYVVMSAELEKAKPVEASFDEQQLELTKKASKSPIKPERTGGPFGEVSRPEVTR